MKDSEFIELLNLYLDHEIAPTDASRLEAEVQSNPARRRVYHDYCRMQKACKMLAEDCATETTPERNVVAFGQGHGHRISNMKWIALAGSSFAAAACLALVFVSRSGDRISPAAATSVVQTMPVAQPTTQPKPATELVATVSDSASSRPAVNGLSLRKTESMNLTAVAQNDPHFAWMQDVRLAPIQMPNSADLRLNVKVSTQPENPTYSSKLPPASDVPWVPIAIRFQR